MRFKYRKTVAVILVLQTVFLWCYILLRTSDPPWKISDFHPNRLDSIPLNDLPTETNGTKLIVSMQAKKNMEALRVTNGDCIGMEFPVHLLQEESWSAINNARSAFVFSAYIVDQGGKIKAVGASVRPGVKVFCQYWHVMHDNQTTVQLLEKPAGVRLLPEDHGNKYTGAVFECPSSTISANYVSFVTRQCSVPLNLLMIKNSIKPQNYQRQFTICLKPLHFRYGRAYELVEWIEFNKILGAEKIVIYNYSIAINTAQVLEHYVKQGIVEVVQWNLPIKSYTWPKTKEPVQIHSIGMLPMLQDCFLRNKAHSEFVVNVDVDEFIIPRSKNVTWSEMMEHVPSSDNYLFRNTFFRKEWNNSQIVFPKQYLAEDLRIITLQTFEREDKIFAAKSRSKYFTRTTKDKILMIHDVSGGSSYVVPTEVGLLHHYRNWQNYKDASKRVVDDTVLRKYGETLIERIQNTWKELGSVKLDIPI